MVSTKNIHNTYGKLCIPSPPPHLLVPLSGNYQWEKTVTLMNQSPLKKEGGKKYLSPSKFENIEDSEFELKDEKKRQLHVRAELMLIVQKAARLYENAS